MPLDRKATWKSLDALWKDTDVKILEARGKKFAIISDTHMGDGGEADDFHGNKPALLNALKYYHDKGYSLILLGDIEEFWQFDLDAVARHYDDSIYASIRKFGEKRVYRIFGNHDYEWGGFQDPIKPQSKKQGLADEALKMKDKMGNLGILLVHGHQGSVDSDKFSWFSRFFVRIFRGFEPLAKATGLYGHGAATKSPVAGDYEKTYYAWGKSRKVLVICGHSHRAVFASKTRADELLDMIADLQIQASDRRFTRKKRREIRREISRLEDEYDDEKEKGRAIELDSADKQKPCYFNSGCGLYSDGITTLDINNDTIRLVKWHRDAIGEDLNVVFKKGVLSAFVKEVTE
jgi:UDP-2,3-diacylglucosamine pyrophosphatase LpxH